MNLNNIVKQNSAMNPLVLHLPASVQLMDEQFFDFCQVNNELRIERTVLGECEIMPPTGGMTGWRNSNLVTQVYIWAELEGSGIVFDSSCGFVLPNGAIRSPDVSWVKKTRLANLTPKQKRQFLPLSPDFLIELRSPSDHLAILQDKMREYLANGTVIGWLIDPESRQVWLYKTQQAPLCLENLEFLTADSLLKGFCLDLTKVWDVGF